MRVAGLEIEVDLGLRGGEEWNGALWACSHVGCHWLRNWMKYYDPFLNCTSLLTSRDLREVDRRAKCLRREVETDVARTPEGAERSDRRGAIESGLTSLWVLLAPKCCTEAVPCKRS